MLPPARRQAGPRGEAGLAPEGILASDHQRSGGGGREAQGPRSWTQGHRPRVEDAAVVCTQGAPVGGLKLGRPGGAGRDRRLPPSLSLHARLGGGFGVDGFEGVGCQVTDMLVWVTEHPNQCRNRLSGFWAISPKGNGCIAPCSPIRVV